MKKTVRFRYEKGPLSRISHLHRPGKEEGAERSSRSADRVHLRALQDRATLLAVVSRDREGLGAAHDDVEVLLGVPVLLQELVVVVEVQEVVLLQGEHRLARVPVVEL